MGLGRTSARPRSTERSTSAAATACGASGRAAAGRARADGAGPVTNRLGLDGYFCSATRGDEVTARRFAFTGGPCRVDGRVGAGSSGPRALPVDLFGCEDGPLAADALGRAGRRHHDTAKACTDGTAHVLLHRDLEERLPTRHR